MPFPSFNSVQEFTAAAGGQIQQFTSYLTGFLQSQHKDDGTHGAITVDSLGSNGNTALNISTNGTVRWGINAAGDLTFGASSHILHSVGTPTLVSGGGTGAQVSGHDSAFQVHMGSAATGTTIVLTFGHPFTFTPAVSVASDSNVPLYVLNASGTGITIARIDGAIFTFNSFIYVTAEGIA